MIEALPMLLALISVFLAGVAIGLATGVLMQTRSRR